MKGRSRRGEREGNKGLEEVRGNYSSVSRDVRVNYERRNRGNDGLGR